MTTPEDIPPSARDVGLLLRSRASERRASLRSSTSELELSDSTDYEEDETAWRAGDDDGDEGEGAG